MAQIVESVELAATPEQVWAVVSDFSRYDEWQAMHKRWKGELPARDEIKAGLEITEVVAIMGMDSTVAWTLVDYDPPRSSQLVGTGLAGVKVSIAARVEPLGAGSRLTIESSFEGQMLVGAIGQAVERAGRAELQNSIHRLAALID